MLKRLLLSLGVCCLLATSVAAQSADPADQNDVINTDNPSLTNGSHCVGTGTVQVESGLYYVSSIQNPPERGPRGRTNPSASQDSQDQIGIPTLFRFGLSPDFELRLGGDIPQYQGSAAGYADVNLAFKYRLVDNPEGLSFAVLAGVDLPTGSQAFRGVGVTPSVDFIVDTPLGEDNFLVFNYALALDQDSEGAPHYLDHFVGAALSHSFSDEWGAYVELSAIGPGQPTGGIFQTIADAGVSYTVNQDWVLNLAVFRGLTNAGMNWGGYVGYGAKW